MQNEKELNAILDALKMGDYEDLYDTIFYENVVRPFKEKYKQHFYYDYGATKGVLVFKELWFVIKIPFTGNCDEEFYGADVPNGRDYCQAEQEKYWEAEKEGLAECFAKTEQIAKIDGHPIYIQEFACMFNSSDDTSTHTKEDMEKVESYCGDDYDCFNSAWLSDVLNYFGETIFYKLMRFIDTFDIRDLHGGNLGYIGMRPVLVDYSSFND